MKPLSFLSTDKCVESLTFNVLGLQVFRYFFAKFLYNLKLLINYDLEFLNFRTKGYQLNENFLEEEHFLKVKEEFNKLFSDKKYSRVNCEYKYEHSIDIHNNIKKSDYPSLYSLLENKKIINFFQKNDLKKNTKIFARAQRINVVDDSLEDSVQEYHSDSFHDTFKSFLYISDVKTEDGPLHVIQNSHALSLTRAFKEWKNSIIFGLKMKKLNWAEKDALSSLKDGSEGDRKKELDTKAIKFSVKKNSIVNVNTHCMHRRGDAKKSSIRDTIVFFTRENPFKIFFPQKNR